MIPDQEHRTVARWIGGLEELERLGYVRDITSNGKVFEVTREGYIAADVILGN